MGQGIGRGKGRTVSSPHAPGKAAADGEANVLIGPHPATDDGEEAGQDASDNLEAGVGKTFSSLDAGRAQNLPRRQWPAGG